MGQVLHGCAKTTHAVRAAIQRSEAPAPELSRRYGINPKTVHKWRNRDTVEDARMGPKHPRSTVLSAGEEALCVAFRRHTLLPLDDCLYALQGTIPHLTRSSLHRCFRRHGISRLPAPEGEGKVRRKFKKYPIGYFHVDIAEVRTSEGRLQMFVAVDRTSKLAFARLEKRAGRREAAAFLAALVRAVPHRIHTVLTDNGVQFRHHPSYRGGPKGRWEEHPFSSVCAEHGIEHRLTKPNHPWTNGQVERMNRTIKEATVKRFHYADHGQLEGHLETFITAYNYAKRLRTLKGMTPHEYICKIWTSEPERFRINPNHHTPGLNT